MNYPIRLGYRVPTKDGDPLTYKKDGHLITVAPTGTGKGRDVLVPALLEYEGSCIVIDPKGQLAAITRRQRERMKQRVIVLNPFNILPEYVGATAQFNPLAALDPSLDSFGSDCDNIADAIIVHDAGGRDSHWNESAHGLISALIGYLAANTRNDKVKNLATVRQTLRKPSLLEAAAQTAQLDQGGKDEMIAEALDGFRNMATAPNNAELSGIVSTARTQTRFLGTKAIAENVSGSDFRFRELKDRPTTVYLSLPTRYLATCSKWFRLVVASALDDLLREETGRYPVLMIIDEFYQIGRLKVLQNAMSLARGYSLQLWVILQDLVQLQEHYDKSWETFLGNAGIRMFFAPRENTTANYVSQYCGKRTITTSSQSKSKSTNPGGSGSTTEGSSSNVAQTDVLLPQDVREIPDDQFLLFADRGSKAVIRGYRLPYMDIPEFKGKYSLDPYHLKQQGAAATGGQK